MSACILFTIFSLPGVTLMLLMYKGSDFLSHTLLIIIHCSFSRFDLYEINHNFSFQNSIFHSSIVIPTLDIGDPTITYTKKNQNSHKAPWLHCVWPIGLGASYNRYTSFPYVCKLHSFVIYLLTRTTASAVECGLREALVRLTFKRNADICNMYYLDM